MLNENGDSFSLRQRGRIDGKEATFDFERFGFDVATIRWALRSVRWNDGLPNGS